MSNPSFVSDTTNSNARSPTLASAEPIPRSSTSQQHESSDTLSPERILSELTSTSASNSSQSDSKPTSLPLSSQLWATSIDRPQISERESIFATTYFPTNSPPSSALRSSVALSNSLSHGGPASEYASSAATASRGKVKFSTPVSQYFYTSTTPSTTLKQQHLAETNTPRGRPISTSHAASSPHLVYSSAMKYPEVIPMPVLLNDDHYITRSPLGSPDRFTDSPRPYQSPKATELDEEKEAERLRYRSWREGRPDLRWDNSSKARSKSGDRTRVDRKIQAIIPDVGPHTISTRSRKSSQYLGLFKEKDAAAESKRRGSRPRDSPAELVSKSQSPDHDSSIRPGISRRRTAPDDSQQFPPVIDTPAHTEETSHTVYQALSHGGPQSRHNSISISSSKSIPDLYRQAVLTKHGVSDGTYAIDASPQHDVHVPGFGQILSTTADQSHISLDSATSTISSDHTERESTAREFRAAVPEDDYESETEHISAATYIPHRQIRPETSPFLQVTRRPTLLRTQSAISPELIANEEEESFEEHDDDQTDVEISLKSQNEIQLWHGEMLDAEGSTEFTPEPISSPEYSAASSASDAESYDDSAASTTGYDTENDNALDQSTPKPIATRRRSRRPREPLGAVPLMPFRHQVGGHNTVFQFSRQTICKKMNNRENVFYEIVERFHPELLDFMPRYIGVLNVTFSKAPKKKRTASFVGSERNLPGALKSKISGKNHDKTVRRSEQARIVSHSQRSMSIPQVIFDQNRHIIPESLFKISTAPTESQSSPGDFRSRRLVPFRPLNPIESISRDSSPKPDIKTWGSTRVNRKLQEQVLREVFAPPVIHHHKHHGRHHSSHGELPLQSTSVGSSMTTGCKRRPRSDLESKLKGPLMLLEEESRHTSDIGIPLQVSRTAPEEDIDVIEQRPFSAQSSPVSGAKSVKRRHSGGGLRRRPIDVVSGIRSNLEFHEADDLGGGEGDEVFTMEEDDDKSLSSTQAPRSLQSPISDADLIAKPSLKSTLTVEQSQPKAVENHHESNQPAQDGRVEMFILLEDLTAKMEKPCVLDLKMGTRQYGVEADETKQRSQKRKCATTTSRELGVRVCGMQVWNAKTQDYIFQDKYFGRDLTAGAEFQDTLKRFFFDGLGHSNGRRYIPVILEQLTKLESIVRKLPGYRFYASSLLILYDQAAGDFEHDNSSPSPPSSTTPPRLRERAGSGPVPPFKPLSRHHRSSNSPIKIKIVDFANCVTKEDTARAEFACIPPRDPNGVDRGYLRGLRTLKLYFQRIWHELLSDSSWVERGEGEGMAVGMRGAGRGTTRFGWEDSVLEDPGNVSV